MKDFHPKYNKVYYGELIENINSSIGCNSFRKGEKIKGVVVLAANHAERTDPEEKYLFEFVSESGRRNNFFTLKDSKNFIKLIGSMPKEDPERVRELANDSWNRNVD